MTTRARTKRELELLLISGKHLIHFFACNDREAAKERLTGYKRNAGAFQEYEGRKGELA
jgi:hypothetical protein